MANFVDGDGGTVAEVHYKTAVHYPHEEGEAAMGISTSTSKGRKVEYVKGVIWGTRDDGGKTKREWRE
jgi:hypothetical protein